MVLVVRTDIGMQKGKAAAQCAHAALACYKKALKSHPDALSSWERTGQAKVNENYRDVTARLYQLNPVKLIFFFCLDEVT